MNTTTQHDAAESCENQHCYTHHVDEPVGGQVHQICFECNHVYRTTRDLRQAYRRELRSFPSAKTWRSTDFEWGRLRRWWMLLTVRAGKIYSCQECSHDF